MGLGSVGLNPENPGSGRVRACTEAVLVNHLQRHLVAELEKQQLSATFTEIEMPTLILLANMELNGFGNYTTFCCFFLNFWRTSVLFVGPLTSMLWTSGDVRFGF